MVYYETGIGFGKMIQLAKYILYILKKRNYIDIHIAICFQFPDVKGLEQREGR